MALPLQAVVAQATARRKKGRGVYSGHGRKPAFVIVGDLPRAPPPCVFPCLAPPLMVAAAAIVAPETAAYKNPSLHEPPCLHGGCPDTWQQGQAGPSALQARCLALAFPH
ncbi:hypothetical protein LPJ57_005730 [Coemansia sp. RSA 486]|nr:hypothetical protein LPJ57_005730 [Coemansia sp. RSA 486]